MSGVRPITSYFKVISKDELEVDELILSQLSRQSRASSLATARSISTVSSKVMSIIVDLTNNDTASSSAGGLAASLSIIRL